MILFIVILMKFINLLSITFLACCISFTEQFSFSFSYLIKQYCFSKAAILSLYVYDLYSFYSGVLLVLLYELQGHPMDLFLQIYFLRANFCWAGRLGKNATSLEGTCCWEIVNSGFLRRFRKDVAM